MIEEVKQSWDSGDKWGSVMAWLFAIADEMYMRGSGPPDAWDFWPGLGINGDVRQLDTFEGETCAEASDDELAWTGSVLWRYRAALERAGLDY